MEASCATPEVFAQIFDRHAEAVHRFLSRRVGDLADDLLSETFLTAFRRRGDYRPERLDVRPWLYGIASNLVGRHRRAEAARYRHLARVPGAESHGDGVDDVVDRADAAAVGPVLAAALAGLDGRDREVLLLVAWGDLTPTEVAAAIDVPAGTVRSRLHRARTQVRARLGAAPAPDLHIVPTTSGSHR